MMKDRTLTRAQRRMPLMWALLLTDEEVLAVQKKGQAEAAVAAQMKKVGEKEVGDGKH